MVVYKTLPMVGKEAFSMFVCLGSSSYGCLGSSIYGCIGSFSYVFLEDLAMTVLKLGLFQKL